MTANAAPAAPSAPAAAPVSWQRLLPVTLLIAAVLLLFRETAAAMVSIWWRSETFTHCLLVPPIVVWLVWRRRERLAALPSRPAPWILLPMAAICLLWLLGELASVNAATQLAMVALIVLAVPAVHGLAVARELTFPLLFLFFSVPIGDFLVPTMMEWTADFTVAALQASGLPVYREGLQFVIPSGHWSVVEACSGVRYLIASFMVGTLFAYLNFSTPSKRWIFVALSLLVPLLANWLRAYMIVMIGHLSGNTLAAGVDHIIYGWVFFGIVIGVMFMIGARYGEVDAANLPPLPALPAGVGRGPSSTPGMLWLAAGSVAMLLVATQAFHWQLARGGAETPQLSLPAGLGGWTAGAADSTPGRWQPAFQNTSAIAEQRYDRQSGDKTQVAVWVGYYRNQNYERKLVTSTNALTEAKPDPPWSQVSSSATSVPVGLEPVTFRTAVLRGAVDASALGAPRLRVWQLYWVGGALTTSDARAKLRLAVDRLLGRGDDGAVVLISTPLAPDASPESADQLLRAFVQDNFTALRKALDATHAKR